MYKNSNKFGIIVAIISFIIGSLFLINFMIFKDLDIAIYGYIYLICTFIVNLIIAIFLLIKAIIQKDKRAKYHKTIFVMLVNIPIAFIYYLIASQFI